MKTIIYFALLTLLASCGKGSGDGSTTSREQNSNNVRVECNSLRNHKDLFSIAQSANLARQECGLTEDEAIKFILSEM